MRFNPNKSFGYPVLRNPIQNESPEDLDYLEAAFQPRIKLIVNPDKPETLSLEYKIDLSDKGIRESINAGNAGVFLDIRCKKTFFAQAYKVEISSEREIELPADELSDIIEIYAYVLANKQTTISSEKIHSDFEYKKFFASRMSVLAWCPPVLFVLSKDQYKSLRSIIDIKSDDEIPFGEIVIATERKYAQIRVHSRLHEKITQADENPISKISLFNSCYYIALSQMLYRLLQSKDELIELMEEYDWARVLVAKCKLYDVEIDDSINIPTVVQKIFDSPLAKFAEQNFETL